MSKPETVLDTYKIIRDSITELREHNVQMEQLCYDRGDYSGSSTRWAVIDALDFLLLDLSKKIIGVQ